MLLLSQLFFKKLVYHTIEKFVFHGTASLEAPQQIYSNNLAIKYINPLNASVALIPKPVN